MGAQDYWPLDHLSQMWCSKVFCPVHKESRTLTSSPQGFCEFLSHGTMAWTRDPSLWWLLPALPRGLEQFPG